MITLNQVLGHVDNPELASDVERLRRAGQVETIELSEGDMLRTRFRVDTDQGTACGVIVARDDRLYDGAVLLLDADRAIVVRARHSPVLRFRARDLAAALQLGWAAGNWHWEVTFEDDVIVVTQSGAKADYLVKVERLLARGDIEEIGV